MCGLFYGPRGQVDRPPAAAAAAIGDIVLQVSLFWLYCTSTSNLSDIILQ